jgi:uncharacterized FlaG/YvyC family protein
MDLSSIRNTNPNLTAPVESPVPREVAEEQRALIPAVKAVNAAGLFGQDNELTFFLDRNTRRAVVRIVNRETREVVDQIPNEYVLRMAEELKRS